MPKMGPDKSSTSSRESPKLPRCCSNPSPVTYGAGTSEVSNAHYGVICRNCRRILEGAPFSTGAPEED
jgi:hypothetical protein